MGVVEGEGEEEGGYIQGCGKLNCSCVIVSKFDQIHSLSDKLGNNWAMVVATDGVRGGRVVTGGQREGGCPWLVKGGGVGVGGC